MRIDIHRPELEALIHERLQSGSFESAEDVIWQALRDSAKPTAHMSASGAKNFAGLFEPVRGLLTDEEVDALFSRNTSTGRRPVDLG
jgi:hypothetical protein